MRQMTNEDVIDLFVNETEKVQKIYDSGQEQVFQVYKRKNNREPMSILFTVREIKEMYIKNDRRFSNYLIDNKSYFMPNITSYTAQQARVMTLKEYLVQAITTQESFSTLTNSLYDLVYKYHVVGTYLRNVTIDDFYVIYYLNGPIVHVGLWNMAKLSKTKNRNTGILKRFIPFTSARLPMYSEIENMFYFITNSIIKLFDGVNHLYLHGDFLKVCSNPKNDYELLQCVNTISDTWIKINFPGVLTVKFSYITLIKKSIKTATGFFIQVKKVLDFFVNAIPENEWI